MTANKENSFINLFGKFGLVLNNHEETSNVLNVEQRIFQNNIRNFVQDGKDSSKVKKILQLLENYFENEVNFVIALMPTKSNSDKVQTHSSKQDSLLKLLIEIEPFQATLFDYLITKMVTYCETNNLEFEIMNMNIEVPTYIINQFRYQPRILEPEALCKKLMDLIKSISSNWIKKEIILCIPDILSDSEHSGITNELEDLLSDTELISATLETLSNLTFQTENTNQIVKKLFTNYALIDESDLSYVVKYLLKSANFLNSKEIMNSLREQILLSEINKEENRFAIYDIMREYFQISTNLANLFMQIITNELTDGQSNIMKQIDFLIICIIYSMPQHCKVIDKLFKQLIKDDSCKHTRKVIGLNLKLGESILKEMFQTICQVSKSLISSPIQTVSNMGQFIFKNSFENMNEKHKQDLVNTLIEDIISTNGHIRDNCLDVLIDLSTNLAAFTTEIQGLLDFIEYFTLSQIRKIFYVVCCLAYNYSNQEIQDQLNMLINKSLASSSLKQKQIGVIGALMIIKNVAECSKNESESDSWQTSKSSFSSDSSRTSVSQEIKNIWQIIIDCSKSSPESLGLFEDDLTCLLQKNSIPNSVELLLKDNVLSMTKNVFQIDAKYQLKLKEYGDKLSSFKYSYDMGLVDHSSGALNLLPQMMNDLQNKSLLVSEAKTNRTTLPCITLASSFRLIAALERQNIGELKDYLGMPILTLNELTDSANLINKFRSVYNDDEKRLVCDSLFYIINWFIELVNAFSVKLSTESTDEDDSEISTKLITRLNNIYELQTVLMDILPYMVYYRPPIAVFGLIDSSTEELPYVTSLVKSKDSKKKKPSKPAKRKKGKENKKPMKKKKKNADDEEDMDADVSMEKEEEMEENEELDEDMEEKELVEDTEEEESVLDASCVNKLAEVDTSKMAFYFREFDLTILKFLKLKLEIVESIPDSSSRTHHSNKNCILKLKPVLFDLILSDLNKKLPSILKSSTNTQTSLKPAFAQPKPTKMNLFLQLNMFDAEKVIKLLMNDCFGSICENLNDISMFVKSIQEKNDNIRDSAELCNKPNNLCLFKCVNQLLKLINVVFVWLHAENDTKLIDEAVKKIGSKLNVSSMSNVSTQCDKAPEIFCYKYLSNLKDIVLDLNSADVLIQLLELLCNKIFPKKRSLPETYEKKCRKILTETCKEFLLNDYNKKISDSLSLSKQSMNEAITNILNVLIKNDENSLEIVERLVEIIVSENFMEDRDNCEEFNTLKSHFNSYFKTLIEYTVTNLKFVEKYDFDIIHSNRNELNELVLKIKRMVILHCSLVNLKKSAAFKEINILSVLKNSKLFLNNFLKYIMPWLDQAFEYHKEDVVAILQELQKTVHYLQEICMTNNNFSVSKQTPVYMRGVESFLLRVKQLLYVNRYDSAFTVDLFQNRFKKVTNTKKASTKKDSKSVKKAGKKGKKNASDAEEETEGVEDEDENDQDEENQRESENEEIEDEEDEEDSE